MNQDDKQPPVSDLLRQAVAARTLEQVEAICRRLQHHPELDQAERREFYSCWEEADLLLERKAPLMQQLYELAMAVGHRRDEFRPDAEP